MVFIASKLLADSIWLRNVYKEEFNGNCSLVHRSSSRVIQCLGFMQVCTLLKFVGEGNLEAVVCVLGLFTVTLMVESENKHPFVRPEILDLHRVRPSVPTMQKWENYFSHPIERESGTNKEFGENLGQFRTC